MTAPTHITFAGLLYLLLLTSAGVPLGFLNGFTVLLSSVLPDVDTGASTIGRLVPWASRRLERRFGHRTLTHSLPFTAALALALVPMAFVDKDVYVCFLAGYASHPVLDSCTMTGVRLLYPVSSVRCVFPMDVNEPMRYRINTGTRQEAVLAVVFLLACIPSFLVAYQGLQRFVRVTRGNIEAAVKDFGDFSPSNLVWVECSAANLLSKERLVGRYRVIGALDERTLVILMPDGKLRTLGKEYRSDYAAEHAVCRKGEPARTIVERIDMSGRRASDIVAGREIHLFGTLVVSDELPRADIGSGFAPITALGREVQLNYATPADLEAFVGSAAIESGFLDVRRVTGESEPVPLPAIPPAEICETLKLHPDAELQFVCTPGDSVPPGGLLAAWDEQGRVRRDIVEAGKAFAALRMSRREKISQIHEKEARLVGGVRSDSIEWETARTLCIAGFLPESSVLEAEDRLRLARRTLAAVAAEREAFETETEAREVLLQNRTKMLQSRLVPDAGRKELFCRNGGIVRGVERNDGGIRIILERR